MVSYVDVLTILLIFFVAAAAKTSATVKNVSVNPLPHITEVSPAPEIVPPKPPLPSPLEQLEQTLTPPAESKEELSLKLEPGGLTISLPQAILFSPGDDRIRAGALPTLGKIADAIRDLPNRINLAGYADSRPIHTPRFHNNWDLAAARSLRLMEILIKKYALDPSRFSVSSYGSNDPRSPNDTEDGRASNRRVEILVMKE
jgi:chemotaxis protein MotB